MQMEQGLVVGDFPCFQPLAVQPLSDRVAGLARVHVGHEWTDLFENDEF